MDYAYLTEQQQQDMLTNRLRDLEASHFQTSLQITQVQSQSNADRAGVENLNAQLANVEAEYAAVEKMLKDAGGEVPKPAKANRALK